MVLEGLKALLDDQGYETASAATGSAHHQPKETFSSRPTNTVADR
jgi:hypothetical protein